MARVACITQAIEDRVACVTKADSWRIDGRARGDPAAAERAPLHRPASGRGGRRQAAAARAARPHRPQRPSLEPDGGPRAGPARPARRDLISRRRGVLRRRTAGRGRSPEEHARWAPSTPRPPSAATARCRSGSGPGGARRFPDEEPLLSASSASPRTPRSPSRWRTSSSRPGPAGMGTTPTVFHWFLEDEYNALLGIDPAAGSRPPVTPLGYPEEFPAGLPPGRRRSAGRGARWCTTTSWGRPRAA